MAEPAPQIEENVEQTPDILEILKNPVHLANFPNKKELFIKIANGIAVEDFDDEVGQIYVQALLILGGHILNDRVAGDPVQAAGLSPVHTMMEDMVGSMKAASQMQKLKAIESLDRLRQTHLFARQMAEKAMREQAEAATAMLRQNNDNLVPHSHGDSTQNPK